MKKIVIVGFVLMFLTSKIKIHNLFFILTYLIYILSFKMLGLSVHMLQVVGYICKLSSYIFSSFIIVNFIRNEYIYEKTEKLYKILFI